MNTTDRKNAFGQDNKQSGASHNSESAAPQKSKRNAAADVVESDFDSIDPADSVLFLYYEKINSLTLTFNSSNQLCAIFAIGKLLR